ncbi:MAG: UDP-phosphate galactose phosphotransferase [Leptolyngbya sp.]|nr:MAG: UDP-phosphate galactose phosphotransferase [Leptolyngbya sp.]
MVVLRQVNPYLPVQAKPVITTNSSTVQSLLLEQASQFSLSLTKEVQDCPSVVHPSVRSSIKRFIDIAGALIGLMITAMVAIPVAIATQFDNPGPLFYSQIRCGHQGKTFKIWKFRSMVVDADKLKHLVNNEAKGGIFKNRNDPRVTCVGRFLRKTSLDELPQFWNVLKGDMSLVGTRPPTIDEVIAYKRHHWERLNVKPGITGEWQANGRSTVLDFEAIVEMDVAYQAKWSIIYDLQLILKTVLVVLNKKGAF